MDGDDVLDRLPAPYALALRLAQRGAPPEEIAEEVAVPVEAVASLLEVAEAKLQHLTGDGDEDR